MMLTLCYEEKLKNIFHTFRKYGYLKYFALIFFKNHCPKDNIYMRIDLLKISLYKLETPH